MGLMYDRWCIDTVAFPRTSSDIVEALKRRGVPYTVFHGDVRNVAPSAFFWGSLSDAYGSVGHGDANNFRCSVYRDKWSSFFKGRNASFSTVKEGVPSWMQHEQKLFCRPDSPLKPFSGRVVDVATYSPASVDVGYYYDDLDLPILFESVAQIGREWRFVLIDRQVIDVCQYAGPEDPRSGGLIKATGVALSIAKEPWQPARAYVLDVAERDGQIGVLEINPISGADFYTCDAGTIVYHISRMESTQHE